MNMPGEEKIIIYGFGDKEAFPSPENLTEYLSEGLFKGSKGRCRFTQSKNADIIVVSREGLAYGHLNVEEKVEPTQEDLESFPPAKCTYLISASSVYETRIQLNDELGIRVGSFGKAISKEQFEAIKAKAGLISTYNSQGRVNI